MTIAKMDEDEIPQPELRCFDKPRSRLEVACMDFHVYFLVDTREKDEEYCRIRNQELEA